MSAPTQNNKRIFKNTIALYIRSILLLLISLYTSRVTLQMLGVEDFGIYALVAGIVQMFAVFGNTLSAATQRFITYALGEGDFVNLRTIFRNSVSLHIVLGAIVAIVLYIVGLWFLYNKLNVPPERLKAAHVALQTTVVTLFFSMFSVSYNGLINAHEKMKAFAYISILEGVLKLSSALVLKIITFDHLIVYSILILGTSVIVQLTYMIYSKKNFPEARNFRFSIKPSLFKKIFAFAGWNLWGEGTMVLRNQGIDILINTFFGVVFNAAKGITNQIHHAVYQFISNFQAAVRPQLTMSVAQHDYRRTGELMFQGSRFSFYLMMIFAIPICISTREILSIWLVEVPPYAVELIRWTMAYLLLDTFSRLSIQAINATGNIRNYQLIVGGMKLLALPITYLFLKLGGSPVTGLVVNVGIEVVCLFIRQYFNKKQIDFAVMPFLIDVVLRCVLVFALALVLPSLVFVKITHSLFIIVPLAMLSSVCCIAFFGVTVQERKFAMAKIREALARLRK